MAKETKPAAKPAAKTGKLKDLDLKKAKKDVKGGANPIIQSGGSSKSSGSSGG